MTKTLNLNTFSNAGDGSTPDCGVEGLQICKGRSGFLQYNIDSVAFNCRLFNITEAVMKLFKWLAVGFFLSTAAPSAFAEMIVAKGNANLCVDMKDRGTSNGTQAQLWVCGGGTNQRFGMMKNGEIRNANRCLTSMTNTSGSAVQLFDCDSSRIGGQIWTRFSDESIRNNFGRCLDIRSSSFNSGTFMQSFNCNGSTAQKFLVYPAEQCFGAIGNGCLGGGGGFANLITTPATDLPGGSKRQWVSVGSIMHDNCCRVNPEGQHCQGFSPAQEGWSDQRMCVREWRKAFYNSFDGFRWQATFGPYPSALFSDSLSQVPGRRGVLHNNIGQAVARYSGVETLSTINLQAPPGTRLDTGDETFCRSGTGRYFPPSGGNASFIICN